MLKLDLWKLLLDLKSIASDILRYIFEPAEWIRYIAIYFNLPSEYDTWPADKPPIYLQKSFISSLESTLRPITILRSNLIDSSYQTSHSRNQLKAKQEEDNGDHPTHDFKLPL